MADYVFTVDYQGWHSGDRVEPHQVLSPNEIRALRDSGKIVEADSKQARTAIAKATAPKPTKSAKPEPKTEAPTTAEDKPVRRSRREDL